MNYPLSTLNSEPSTLNSKLSTLNSKKAQAAVIILNWNGVKNGLLRRYLPSVISHTASEVGEVIVADNGSTDESLKVMQEEFPQVRVIALDQNYGFAEGYNRAIAQVEHPYVVLLNDDVRVTPHWLEPMVAYMEAHPDCAGMQPKLLKDGLREGESETFEYAGACGGYLDNMCYPYCRGRIFDTVEEDHGQYDLPEGEAWPVMWATGACLMVRAELYKKAGGLDRRFFAHMEEIDLCWRLRRMGYQLVCLPQPKVYHLGGASLPQGNPRKTKLNFRNSLVMMWKNLSAEVRDRKILHRKELDALAALNYLRQGQWGNFRAIITAHHEADEMIASQYDPKKLSGFGQAQAFPHETFSILRKYYLSGVKKYSDLGL